MKKWTQQMRATLYESLVLRFGPHESWERGRTPNVSREEYEAFLTSFVAYCQERFGVRLGREGRSGIEAVDVQISFALSDQEEVNERQIVSWLLNKAAALEAGFISHSELQKMLRGTTRLCAKPDLDMGVQVIYEDGRITQMDGNFADMIRDCN